MKGEKFLRIVIIVLCCVVASYILISVARSSGTSFTTYKAVLYEVGDGISTSGFVVRSEEPVYGGDGIVALVRAEGEKVGKGQVVAATYRSREAQVRASQIEDLEEELAQMEYAYQFSSSNAENATLDSDIVRLICQVNAYAARRDYTFAAGSSDQLKTYVLRRYISSADSEVLWDRITRARETLNGLYAEAESESGAVTVNASGYFSGSVDGYEEELTPEFLEFATPAQFSRYGDLPRRNTSAIGKLVTAIQWYYATLVPAVDVQELKPGSYVEVSFAYDFHQNVNMKVERISAAEEGKCLLVLSCDKYVQMAVSTRAQKADLIFDNKSGLRVPKQAIYANDKGESGVYILEGAKAKWKTVEIIHDNGESYIVKLDKSSIDNLRPEDEIILTTEEMFEGKVMVH